MTPIKIEQKMNKGVSTTTMEALNETLAKLEKKYQDIQGKKRDLELEELSIAKQREWLEEERLKLSNILSTYEEEQLKKELTAVGELLELPAVVVGSLRVVSEEPTDKEKQYSIDITCVTSSHSGVTGLSVDVVVSTLSPKVEAIAKELFVQEGTVRGTHPSELYWERHWDYYTHIRLTTHEALSY
jgi:hypothetical protein